MPAEAFPKHGDLVVRVSVSVSVRVRVSVSLVLGLRLVSML